MIIDKGTMKVLLSTLVKGHIQPFCSNIHIFKSGYAAATDGSLAFVSNKLDMTGSTVSKDLLINLGTVSMTNVENFIVDETKGLLSCKDKNDELVALIPFETQERSPFNFKTIYDRHVPNTSGNITLDPKYMRRLAAVFPDNSDIYFKVGQEGTPSIVIGERGALIIMPKQEHVRELPDILIN